MPWLAAVAVLLIALAFSAIIRDLRRECHDDTEPNEHPSHAHLRGIGWLLALPVILLAFVAPPALGAQAAAPLAVTLSPNELRQPFPPLPAGRAPEISLKDVIKRAALDSAGTLNSRLITVIGFTLKDGNGTDLARITIFCCAADAQLGRLHLRGAEALTAAELPDNPGFGGGHRHDVGRPRRVPMGSHNDCLNPDPHRRTGQHLRVLM